MVRHSYVKGVKGLARGRAHINYIQFRKGNEKEKHVRLFFNNEGESISGRQVQERLKQQERYGVQMHKLVLSPGVSTVDLKEYTRETMHEIGRHKGLKLDWYAVEHRNTDHPHVHVVVMGRDLLGHRVRFEKGDHRKLQQLGDEYLEREHRLERYLDRDMHVLLGDPLLPSERKGEERPNRSKRPWTRNGERDWFEWQDHDRLINRILFRDRAITRRITAKQFHIESGGRLLDFHERYQNQESRRRLNELAAREPGTIDALKKMLSYIDGLEVEARKDKEAREISDTNTINQSELERRPSQRSIDDDLLPGL